tara:strand:- start:97 stop:696 length:600 start_codon:yes stop_codon:yes gene_type:complete
LRYIYLISPKKIKKNFYKDLDEVLSQKKVKYFQLRLKNLSKKKIIQISKKIKKITTKHDVKFILNDKYKLVKDVRADGCHVGQKDGPLKEVKKFLNNRILGVTCHNSLMLAKKAIKFQPTYLAFGSFHNSSLKPKAIRADFKLIPKIKKKIKIPIVAIGGINNSNYKRLLKLGVNLIAISSFIWDNPKLKPKQAIKKFI